jgi:hypothetical protein
MKNRLAELLLSRPERIATLVALQLLDHKVPDALAKEDMRFRFHGTSLNNSGGRLDHIEVLKALQVLRGTRS